jgi:hypothetical protein
MKALIVGLMLLVPNLASSSERINMLDPKQFMEYIIIPVLEDLNMDSEEARMLMIGTALVESNLRSIRQVDGPALGVYQMEPDTIDDVHRYLKVNLDVMEKFQDAAGYDINEGVVHNRAVWDLKYATALARVKYWMDEGPLPKDINGLAKYWKHVYNTNKGKGMVHVFGNKLRRYMSMR